MIFILLMATFNLSAEVHKVNIDSQEIISNTNINDTKLNINIDTQSYCPVI